MPTTESPSTVLIVDDDEDCRHIYGLALEHAGFSVLTANDGEEGLRIARRDDPQVILMDVAMPVMDGLAALRQLRSLAATRDLPIVGVTAMATTTELANLTHAGFDELLTKPVAPNEIVAVVRRLLPPARSQAESSTTGPSESSPGRR